MRNYEVGGLPDNVPAGTRRVLVITFNKHQERSLSNSEKAEYR